MRKLSQEETLIFLNENFLDSVRDVARGAASVAKSVSSSLMPHTAGALRQLKGLSDKFRDNLPVKFFLEYTSRIKEIEVTEILDVERVVASPKKGLSRISKPKNVSLIEFKAVLYSRKTGSYAESVNIYEALKPAYAAAMDRHAARPTPAAAAAPTPASPAAAAAPTPASPASSTIYVAEVFRTTSGLQMGDIYRKDDPDTSIFKELGLRRKKKSI